VGTPFGPWTGKARVVVLSSSSMHYDAHQPVIADFEARILTIRDSL